MANILVVDDELGIRDLLSEILNDEGHAVELAENAAQARVARQQARPDLVLLDIWMPDTDGVTLLKEWSTGGQLTMPVIMMSGHATIDTAVEATRIGAMSFLEKPITLQKLLKAVELGLTKAVEKPRASVQAASQPSSELTVEFAMTGGALPELPLTWGASSQSFDLEKPCVKHATNLRRRTSVSSGKRVGFHDPGGGKDRTGAHPFVPKADNWALIFRGQTQLVLRCGKPVPQKRGKHRGLAR